MSCRPPIVLSTMHREEHFHSNLLMILESHGTLPYLHVANCLWISAGACREAHCNGGIPCTPAFAAAMAS
jgi:hypothetical protein